MATFTIGNLQEEAERATGNAERYVNGTRCPTETPLDKWTQFAPESTSFSQPKTTHSAPTIETSSLPNYLPTVLPMATTQGA